MGDEGHAGLAHVAAQGHDMPHAGGPIGFRHAGDIGLAGIDTGKVRGGGQLGLGNDPPHGVVGAIAGRAARTVGYRDELRGQRRKAGDHLPQLLVHRFRLGRKEFEADTDVARQAGKQRRVERGARLAQGIVAGDHGETFADDCREW